METQVITKSRTIIGLVMTEKFAYPGIAALIGP